MTSLSDSFSDMKWPMDHYQSSQDEALEFSLCGKGPMMHSILKPEKSRSRGNTPWRGSSGEVNCFNLSSLSPATLDEAGTPLAHRTSSSTPVGQIMESKRCRGQSKGVYVAPLSPMIALSLPKLVRNFYCVGFYITSVSIWFPPPIPFNYSFRAAFFH